MRRAMTTVLAIALIAAGVAAICFEFLYEFNVGRLAYMGPFLVTAGGLVIASDWFGL